MAKTMTQTLWRVAHMLAADMALNRVSKNLVRGASEYLLHYPEAALLEYAEHLESLGDLFAAGESGKLERVDFRRALQRVKSWPTEAQETRLLLEWVARLIAYYEQHPEEARDRSLLNFERLRSGRHLEGVVRECKKGTIWVQVASGQWGRGRRQGEEVGDRVRVEITQAHSPTDFRVKVERVIQRVARPEPAQEESSPVEDIPEPPDSDDEVSESAKDFMAFLQKKWSEEEE